VNAQAYTLKKGPSVTRYLGGPFPADQSGIRSFASKWAIVIGINNFHEPTWNLKYAAKDASDFSTYLLKDCHFQSKHMKLLLNNDATKAQIANAFDWCAASAKTTDLVVIYIRTRGTPPLHNKNFLATSSTKADAIDSTSLEMQSLVDHTLKTIHSKATVLIVDADYSGNIYWSVFPEPPDLLRDDQALSIICSAENNQICWESKQEKNSVFTGELLRVLQRHKDVPIGSAAAGTHDSVEKQVQQIRPFREQSVSAIGMAGGECASDDIIIGDPVNSEIQGPAGKRHGLTKKPGRRH
jgi:uncharacterized caspase-like protein